MAATDWLQFLTHQSNIQLSRDQYQLLDHYIFICICAELCRHFCCDCHDHDPNDIHQFYGVGDMPDRNFVGEIIKDILHSEDYTLEGVAYYTHTEVEVIYEIVVGRNPNPSISLSRKIIGLHKEVRPELYRKIIKRCLDTHLKEIDAQQ